MNHRLKSVLYSIAIIALAYLPAVKSYAQADSLLRLNGVDSIFETQLLINQSHHLFDSGKMDSAKSIAEKACQISFRNNNVQGQVDALVLLGKINFKSGNNNQALYAFWQTIKLKSKIKDKSFSERIYYNMAVTFASMKQYPLALKYFSKAHHANEKKMLRNTITTSEKQEDTALYSHIENVENIVSDTSKAALLWSDDPIHLLEDKTLVIDADTMYIRQRTGKKKELKITGANILHSFDDGKQGMAYGLIIHTKQPISGKRKSFSGINTVGHMFITLIKYNSDTEYTSRTFGFYPDKDNFLSATPLIPTSTSTFKDDGQHDWDEIVAKFIPKHSFNKILRMVKKYSRTKYNLNKNNCTDFGLCVASVAGIQIKDTHGSWPLGSGNNPGFAGQSIIDDKVLDDNNDELLIIDAAKDNLQ